MKHTFFFIAVSIATFATAQTNTFPSTGAAGIGTTTPDKSSLLEIKSTTTGLLIPRMTKAQRDAILSPATGLMIFQTNNTPGFYYYSGTAWNAVTPKSKGWSLTGNAGTNPSTNFIGTTDAQPLIFKTNNQRAGLIDFDNLKANTAFGYQAFNANTAGSFNTAIGSNALYFNTGGSRNTANGYLSLYYNNTGHDNSATGALALIKASSVPLYRALGRTDNGCGFLF